MNIEKAILAKALTAESYDFVPFFATFILTEGKLNRMRSRRLLPIVLITKVLAVEFATPSTWQGTNITVSTTERQAIIGAAISEVFNNGTGNDDFFSILAVYDLYNNQTTYKQQVTAYFATNSFAPNELNQGLDAMRAYQVYQDSAMLTVATSAWSFGRSYTISAANVDTGSIPLKSFNFTKTCSGVNLVGGTFWKTDVGDPNIFGTSTALSAYLFQVTSDNTYLSAAQDSGAFMLDIMNITGTNNGIAAMSVNNSASCGDIFGPGSFRLDHTGYFLEGLAVLPNSTTFGKENISVGTLSSNLVNMTLTADSLCNAANGIINIGSGVGDQYLVQGLGALYRSISGASDLVTYIGNFLSVQYNTVVTAATDSNSNIYSGSWIGPPSAQYDPGNQTLALYALVNAAQEESSGESCYWPRSRSYYGAQLGVDDNVQYLQKQQDMASFNIDALYMSEDQSFHPDRLQPQRLSTITPSAPTMSPTMSPTGSGSAGYTGNNFGIYEGKHQQRPGMHVSNSSWGPSGESRSTDPISENPPSTTDSVRLGQISTNDLLQLLQTRIQQQGRPEQGTEPPAYEAS
ncbi:hypothetical protein BT96DRAFT_933277 [Gymnopus androsaceus JB14]|uniref:Uncharacterized protein n=1 Tax=Gymnopus androsaceus JB14 TaxID=1447944 RepID=A0A6A4IEL0_9AGAR|nr:hypothetical protein BT96DRAFT_933277 [Gymnopus androsaceus JB14]